MLECTENENKETKEELNTKIIVNHIQVRLCTDEVMLSIFQNNLHNSPGMFLVNKQKNKRVKK